MNARVVWESENYRAIEKHKQIIFERLEGTDALGVKRWASFKKPDFEIALHSFVRLLIFKKIDLYGSPKNEINAEESEVRSDSLI